MEMHELFRKVSHDIDYLRGKWVVIGDTFFGDNGKGKVTNFTCFYLKEILGLPVAISGRFNGGDNAGHATDNPWGPFGPEGTFKANVVPSGIFQDLDCLIGAGAVFSPERLIDGEMQRLAEYGLDIDKIFVSLNTHLILPHYETWEMAIESMRGKDAVGTTKKAIGPTYAFKADRLGITVRDLIGDYNDLIEKLRLNYKWVANHRLVLATDQLPHWNEVCDRILRYRDKLTDMAVNEQVWFTEIREKGLVGVAEIGQGDQLSINNSNYPKCTSSISTISGAIAQANLSYKDVGYVIVVNKGTYNSKVGNGDFPTEMPEEEAELFRKAGNEYGTTTGRPRRCGYLDIATLKQALIENGADCLCLTKMDITADQEKIKVKTVSGHYEEWNGWKQDDIAGIQNRDKMPDAAVSFVENLEVELGNLHKSVISLVSTGPNLEDMVIMDDFLKKPA